MIRSGKVDNFWKICIVWILLYVLAFGSLDYRFSEEEPAEKIE